MTLIFLCSNRNNSRESGTCSTVIKKRVPGMRLQAPGQHGTDGLLPLAQAGIAIDQIYGTLDW